MRNRVIEYLQLAGSFEQQDRYAQAVPNVNVPYEVINQWEDWGHTNVNADPNLSPVYSSQELDAMKRFHVVWDRAADALPDDYPSMSDAQAIPEWSTLRDEARAATAVFNVRGRMSEEREVE